MSNELYLHLHAQRRLWYWTSLVHYCIPNFLNFVGAVNSLMIGYSKRWNESANVLTLLSSNFEMYSMFEWDNYFYWRYRFCSTFLHGYLEEALMNYRLSGYMNWEEYFTWKYKMNIHIYDTNFILLNINILLWIRQKT